MNHTNNKVLLIATHNKGKFAEIKRQLLGIPYQVLSLNQIGISYDVPETGTTYVENALLKAQEYAKLVRLFDFSILFPSSSELQSKPHLWGLIADDGGLEIDALGGQPGVYSSRYAGPNKTDEEKIAFVLEKLKNVPPEKRQASFRTVVVLAHKDKEPIIVEGAMEGTIALKAQGTPRKGLPYWQIFIPKGFDKTVAQLHDEGIDYISHRQKALTILKQKLI